MSDSNSSNSGIPKHKIMKSNQPIGVFDSGMGGLSIVKELQAYLPQESIIYLADTKNVPYGERSDDQIRELTAQAVAWLYMQGCKAVVVACNTASAFSLTHLREYYGSNFPVIGLVPAVKPAVLKSNSKAVGVLATPGTLRGTLLKDVIQQVAVPNQVRVITAVSPALVPFVERGQQDSLACRNELARVLQPLADAGVDQLVLGCTHYPFLKNSIRMLFDGQFELVDSGMAVARQTGRVLVAQQLNRTLTALQPTDQPTKGRYLTCYVTGDVQQAQPVLNALMQTPMAVELTVYLAEFSGSTPVVASNL